MSDCCDEPALLPIDDALARMREAVTPVVETERVALMAALDRVLGEPVRATLDVPAQDNSAMDGYALRSEDAIAGKRLRLIGRALAGHGFEGQVEAGTCVRITTGAAIPAGADCVVMQEHAEAGEEAVTIMQAARAGDNVRCRGEDIRRDSDLLPRGHRIGPVDLGLLASLGMDGVTVLRRLRVAVLSTGDELTPPGEPLPAGHVYDSNRYAITAMLHRLGVDVLDMGLVPDAPEAIAAAFQRASREADALISSGGVSVGDADYVKDILGNLGQINFWKVAIKPGKPFAFGQMGESWFFGLPGNPVSSVVTLHQLALPVLRHMAGESVEPPLVVAARASKTLRKRPGRTDYQRARAFREGAATLVSSTGAQGSGVLTSFSGANCYVRLEQERGSVAEGEAVEIIPFDRFIS